MPSSRDVRAPDTWPSRGHGGRRAAAKRSLPTVFDAGTAFAFSAGTAASGGSAGSPSLPPQTVNGRTFAEMEIMAYVDFCLTVSVRKQWARWKPRQAPSLCSGERRWQGGGCRFLRQRRRCQGTAPAHPPWSAFGNTSVPPRGRCPCAESVPAAQSSPWPRAADKERVRRRPGALAGQRSEPLSPRAASPGASRCRGPYRRRLPGGTQQSR